MGGGSFQNCSVISNTILGRLKSQTDAETLEAAQGFENEGTLTGIIVQCLCFETDIKITDRC